MTPEQGLQNDIDEIIRRCTDGGGGSGVAAAEVIRYLHANTQILSAAHVHNWDILGVKPETPRNIHPRDTRGAYTIVLVRCKECNWPETTELDGLWTKDQILAVLEDVSRT